MTPTQTLTDRTVIVTGASSGIGAATVDALAADGANLVLAARREGRLEEIAAEADAEHGAETLVVPTDVTDREAVDTLIEETLERFGGLDALVNNAGLGLGGDVETMTDEEFETMQSVNVDGVFYATRAALPHVRASEGHLLFVGSFAGQYPRPQNPVYAATKWWVRGFAHSVAAQVGDDDVAVTVVNPSEVRSEFGGNGEDSFEERFEEGEVSEPEEIADAIRFALTRSPSAVSELDLFRRDKFSGF
ncbi:SDR family oxidoreductase [Natronobiforma cellulositropha]|uniref:SDR family oxidoreductase n=1 Tax=Natronobiforma cellulositropha TaxID=1679076 RepID=UPI0021D5F833|nr:SDR family oxidoreductase [Natronobiforma cellulositropha]